MTWKRNKDGGLDFDVTQALRYQNSKERYEKAKEKLGWSAHTVTHYDGCYPVVKLTPREERQLRIKNKNDGS